MSVTLVVLAAACGLVAGHGFGSPCYRDMKKLCPEQLKQRSMVPFFKTECFEKNRANLSPACTAMYEFHQARQEMKNVMDGFMKDFAGVRAKVTGKNGPALPNLPVAAWATQWAILPADHIPVDAVNKAGGVDDGMGGMEHGMMGMHGGMMEGMEGKHHEEHEKHRGWFHGQGGQRKGPFHRHMHKFCHDDADRLCGTQGPRCERWKCLWANKDQLSQECQSVMAGARAWHQRFHANDNAMEHMRMMHQQQQQPDDVAVPVMAVEPMVPMVEGKQTDTEGGEEEEAMSSVDLVQFYMMVSAVLLAVSVALTFLAKSISNRRIPPTPAAVYVALPSEDVDEKPVKA